MKSTLILLLLVPMFFSVSIADTRKTIRYGILDVEFLPYQYFENGLHRGPDADIVKEVFKRLAHQYHVTYEALPVKRAEHQLKYGDVDMTAMFKTPAREVYSIFTHAALHWSTYKIAVLKEKEFPFKKIADLEGKKFGIMRGNSISLEFDRAVKHGSIKVQQAKTSEGTLLLLQRGRVDAIVGNIDIIKNYAEKLNISNQISFLQHPLSPEKPFRFMISKNSKSLNPALLKNRLDDVLAEMQRDGTFDRIYKKHNLRYEVPLHHKVRN